MFCKTLSVTRVTLILHPVPYLFISSIDKISHDLHIPMLAKSQNASDSLFLDHGIPLRLEKIHAVCYGEIEPT
jgi:hypothetical protein